MSLDLADDLLEGVRAIGAFTGMTPRRLFYLAETRQLPIFKVGNRWCALRSALRAHFAALSQECAGRTASQNGLSG
jgi:hypothetical protein